MMRISFIALAVVLLMALSLQTVFAQQIQYEQHLETEELLVEYRWQHERALRKTGDAVLNLQITNLSDDFLEATFFVVFYHEGRMVFESDENLYCFRPGQRRRAGRAGLRFAAGGITMEAVEGEDFEWDILIREVRLVDGCE